MPTYFFIVLTVFGYLCWKAVIDAQERRREQRLDLLEKAIESGSLDRATLEGISRIVNDQPLVPRIHGVRMLFVGWMLMFLGAGGVVLSMATNQWSFEGVNLGVSAVTVLLGFALTTYPFAVRELEGRDVDRAESLR